jgi:hypothetical protein
VAFVIVWRRSDDGMALLTSFTLIVIAVTLPSAGDALALIAGAQLPADFLYGGVSIILCFYYLFPDGQFIPRWTRVLLLVWFIYSLASLVFPGGSHNPYTWPPTRQFLWIIVWLGSGVLAQLYRYRYVATPLQRQQTKWIVFGAVVAYAGAFSFVVLLGIFAAFGLNQQVIGFYISIASAIRTACLLAMPVTMALAVLRHRLWDIDLIIRRTLVYSLLTGLLAIIYLGGVMLMQSVLHPFLGQDQNQFATVLSTLAIAALFTPVRRRVQDGIDRRFYRRRYNAEQVLVAFSTTLRNETDLEQVATTLLAAVNSTVQPTHLSVWLRKLK